MLRRFSVNLVQRFLQRAGHSVSKTKRSGILAVAFAPQSHAVARRCHCLNPSTGPSKKTNKNESIEKCSINRRHPTIDIMSQIKNAPMVASSWLSWTENEIKKGMLKATASDIPECPY